MRERNRYLLLNDYMRSAKGQPWEADRRQFMEEFLDNRERFKPTDQAI